MRSADAHLTPQELQDLLFAAAEPNVTTADRSKEREAQQHLDGCDVCKGMARKYANVDSALKALGPRKESLQQSDVSRRGSECPPDQTWLRLAAGLIHGAAASQHVSHAAMCDCCGLLLKEAMQDLAQDITAEEEVAIGSLGSAGAEWQRKMGRRLAAGAGAQSSTRDTKAATDEIATRKRDSGDTEKKRFSFLGPQFAFAIAASVVVAVAGWILWQKLNPDPNKLLAEAYGEHRTIELRISGAHYGPLRVERGAGQAYQKSSPSLLEAEAILARNSAKHPEDPVWLQAQARAHLLVWNYQAAIEELDEALTLKPEDASLLVDEATAFFEKGEKLNAPVFYGQAAEILGQVLSKNSEDPVALFNRAVVYEKLQAPHEAIEDLKHYLRVEPNGDWAQEAASRLGRLQQITRAHDDVSAEPLANPADLVRMAGDPRALKRVDDQIERYLDVAIREWLPRAFTPDRDDNIRSQTLSALRVLGDLLAREHRDAWLNDLLDSANASPAFAAGIVSLGRAVTASDQGIPSTAYSESIKAEESLANAGSTPGTLRAATEEVYSLQRSQRGDQCLNKAEALQPAAHKAGYPWIEAQLDIEQSSCSIMLERFGRARVFVKRAEREATDARYVVLQMRQLGIAAAIETDEGDISGAMTRDIAGLAEYWRANFAPPIRGHQFYTDLSLAGEKLKQWHLALAMAKEGARSVSLTSRKSEEALTHALVGRLAFRVSNFDLATAELGAANVLLAALPSSEATRTYQMDAQIDLAGVELEQANLLSAETRLKSVEGNLPEVRSFTIPLRFHETYANLYEKQNRFPEAEEAFRNAIEIADSGRQMLDDPDERYTWNQETSQLYREAVQLELRKGDTDRALAIWEWYRSSAFHVPGSLGTASDFSALEAKLAKMEDAVAGQTVISYAVLPGGFAIWVLDAHRIYAQFFELDSNNLLRMASHFTRMCGDRSSDLMRLKASGKALYRLLIEPVADRLTPGRTILIEADDLFSDLPFEALVTPDDRYWGSAYALVFSPGLFYEQQLRLPVPLNANSKALVVSSSATTTQDGAALTPILSQIDQETGAISARFKQPMLLAGSDASFDKVEALLPTATIFHFAGHAVTNGFHEGLLFATPATLHEPEGTIWGADRAKPTLLKHLQLAVLSACSTGQISGNRLETHHDFVRAMLVAGVPQIVASRWDVDSLTTARFMDVFYSELIAGNPLSTAVAKAESELRVKAETQHPYYWAALAGFGRSN